MEISEGNPPNAQSTCVNENSKKKKKKETLFFLLHLAFMRVTRPAPSASGTHSFAQLWPDSSCNFSFFLWPELGSPLRAFLHAHLTAWIHKPFPLYQDSLHRETPVEQCWRKEGTTRIPWSPVTSQAKSIGWERPLSWPPMPKLSSSHGVLSAGADADHPNTVLWGTRELSPRRVSV